MNIIYDLNKSLKYIEEHLEGPLNPAEIAHIALMSEFHYQRFFSMMTGCSLGEYIRKRRLTVAAKELVSTEIKIIDLALKYGYETPEAFSKAFKRLHGVAPSRIVPNQTKLFAFTPLSFQLTVKGENNMNYRIVKEEAFNATGYVRSITSKNGQNLIDLPRFWEDVMNDGSYQRLEKEALKVDPQNICMGICYDFEDNNDLFKYAIALKGDFAAHVAESKVVTIPKSTWAVFESKGPLPGAIQAVWKQIYAEWFPATTYEHAGTAEIEVYLNGDPDSEDYICEVWIPVVEKSE